MHGGRTRCANPKALSASETTNDSEAVNASEAVDGDPPGPLLQAPTLEVILEVTVREGDEGPSAEELEARHLQQEQDRRAIEERAETEKLSALREEEHVHRLAEEVELQKRGGEERALRTRVLNNLA